MVLAFSLNPFQLLSFSPLIPLLPASIIMIAVHGFFPGQSSWAGKWMI